MKNLKAVIPVIHSTNIEVSLQYYCEGLGFTKEWDYCQGEGTERVTYVGLQLEGIWIHLSSFSGDGVTGSVTAFAVSDVDALFSKFQSNKIEVGLEPCDQSWGNREMYLNDPDGNHLRFIQEK
ncbi:VOC family protein [Coraliomargarita algicola]|uniref:Bleomycin resistance protein n=1 Tax=Coraliomargarita algicola TaxID=3092156 RepID=A0ABZ0REW3_9BACT|nr:VOC family protein [Coraliomargarita sp. J2-16]WPJ94547.1 VOC family protein [Coraliomargarita sp. J2-16]